MEYQNAYPFPHLVKDHYFDEELLCKAVEDLKLFTEERWGTIKDPLANEIYIGTEEVQVKKMGINNPALLPQSCQLVIDHFSSPQFMRYLFELTQIPDLEPDEKYVGGGLHRVIRGGKLSLHADFNLHPTTKKHRRVNVLLYLNRDWKPEYEGKLELWDLQNFTKPAQEIAPIFNRMVIFNITDQAIHGHPVPYQGPERLSLAFYYYTTNRPEHEKSAPHMANWYSRPGVGF